MYHQGTPTWRFHTGLCKLLRNISTNIKSLRKRKGLKLGEVSYFFYFYNITIFFHWIVFDLLFYCVTVKTIYSLFETIRFFHQSHNTVHFGGLFTLKQWIISSLKHDTVPRVNKLHCFYVKNPPKRIALWDRENSQFVIRYSGLFAIRYSGFPDTPYKS